MPTRSTTPAVTPGARSGGAPARVRDDEAVEVLRGAVAAAHDRAAGTLGGGGVLVVIDGLTGSGKTTLAQDLARALAQDLARDQTGAPAGRCRGVLAVEDLVPGWESLTVGVGRCAGMLAALSRGQEARSVRWDWVRMTADGLLVIPPLAGGVLIVEGCGALAAAAQDLGALEVLRVLVRAPAALRHRRIAARDPYVWDVGTWEGQERELARLWQGTAWEPDLLVCASGPG